MKKQFMINYFVLKYLKEKEKMKNIEKELKNLKLCNFFIINF